jgi:hypothetical protein
MKWLSLVAVLSACKSEPAVAPQPLQPLATLDPVKAEFNAHAGEPRFVTLLSAT